MDEVVNWDCLIVKTKGETMAKHYYVAVMCKSASCDSEQRLKYLGQNAPEGDDYPTQRSNVQKLVPYLLRYQCSDCGRSFTYGRSDCFPAAMDDPPAETFRNEF
jgi:hypothetical protein